MEAEQKQVQSDKEREEDKDKEGDKKTPGELLFAYRTFVTDDYEKINEKWAYAELRKNIHDTNLIMIGIKNYGASKGGDLSKIKKFDTFIASKIYMKYQTEIK